MKYVVKLGGAGLEVPALLEGCTRAIADLVRDGHQVVVVHGGGAQLTRMLKALGKQSEFIAGLRVTDAETRDVALMVLAGKVNKGLVAALGALGQPAVGLSGGDGLLFRARKKRTAPDLNYVDVGPIDRIFTRIGAGDDLAGGRSTFMVEMTEAANILNNATDKSLILMDEIGRGTSTFDGLSLAWAVARHIARVNRSFTLFATHYFELTNLAHEIDGIANVHLDATEHRDGIVFLHAVKEGPASRSYGLAVAQLAGVPREVIAAAREYLAALESGAGARGNDQGPATANRSRGRRNAEHTPQAQLPLEAPPPPPVDPRLLELEAALRAVNADDLTPRAALDLIYKLHALAN